MGYTHYWTYRRDGDQREWADALSYVHRILEARPCPLQIEYSDRLMRVNGYGPCDGGRNHCTPGTPYACSDPASAEHEDFILYTTLAGLPPSRQWETDPATYWDFCKTAQKSYDIPVSAILALVEWLAPTCITVESDGDLSDWEPGIALAREATGLPIEAPASIRKAKAIA